MLHNPSSSLIFISLIIFFFLNGYGYFTITANANAETKKLYIVYLGEKPHNDHKLIKQSHHELLASVVGSKEEAEKAMLYSYRYGFSGFAAKLTNSQAKKLAGLPGVASVVPDKKHAVHTSRSWEFLGLSENAKLPGDLLRKTKMGDQMIVGLIDSGIMAASPSFSDDGLGPIPERWRGKCRSMSMFNATEQCNRKLIGARWFFKGSLEATPPHDLLEFKQANDFSALDNNGHGTQTASIVGGSFVPNITYGELDFGVPRGGVPQARLAVYKACWHNTLGRVLGCAASDLLSAFDYAIHDGVDVISVSIGLPVPLLSDMDIQNGIGIGSFHAVAHGISVVVAGGNNGPAESTITNVEPWLLTVGASTTDRIFSYPITLGNGETFTVNSDCALGIPTLLPLVFVGSYMSDLELNNVNLEGVNGKIMFMFGYSRDSTLTLAYRAAEAGAYGLIYSNPPGIDSVPRRRGLDFPYVQVDFEVGARINEYIFQEENATVKLGFSTIHAGNPIIPKVTAFSSRGPSSLTPAIMKPDIAAPGDKILCSTSPEDSNYENGFSMNSGTSHAAPHVAAIVALLRASHPEWSPAALKSALVTTAWNSDTYVAPIFSQGSSQSLANAFDFGGGIANANGADDPGLVYDMRMIDYAQFLCSLGYNNSIIYKSITDIPNSKEQTVCPKTRPALFDLNLPSFVVPSLDKQPVTLKRTVSNVGPVNSVYKAVIKAPNGVLVSVEPNVLRFDANTKKRSFTMKVSADKQFNSAYTFGSLTWTDGDHFVRSPIAVRKLFIPVYF